MLASRWPSSIAAAALLLLISSPVVAAAGPPVAIGLPGCNTTCGGVAVPYPFGIGPEGCYWPGLNLTCDYESKPPRLLLGHGSPGPFEVVDVSLEHGTVRVVSHKNRGSNERPDKSPWHGLWSLGDIPMIRPYILKPGSNEFILTGCNVQATLVWNASIISGCVSFCATTLGGDVISQVRPNGGNPNPYTCSNMGCCQSSIVIGSDFYEVEFQLLNELGGDLEMNVLIAEVGWFTPLMVYDLNRTYTEHDSWVPVLLQWAVPHGPEPTNTDTSSVAPCPDAAARSICKSANSHCADMSPSYYVEKSGYYSCHCKEGYHGNPYLAGGCQDVKECDQKENYGCFGDCQELTGSFRCRCPEGTDGNYTIPGGCVMSTQNAGHRDLGLIIGLSVASGPCILLFVLGALLIIRDLKQRKTKTLRRKFFTQNRGQLLKQLVSHRADIAERMLISLEELEKATNNFDQARRLGGGGHGTVYKGILSDLHVVAIKKSNIVVRREIDEFINEVAILSQINHRNIVKLRGCCLETEVPLLAYEFVSSGTLSDHLHTVETKSLPWKDRLRITSEIGKALAYLHSAVSVPVIHRDIKPSNILLDDSLTAKVSDFGASRYIPVDQTGTTTAVQGTIGYLDPMYYYTRRLTETSDVYSFGVLLVELLTRRKPSMYRSSEGDGLVMQFVRLLAEGNLDELLDPQVVEEGGSDVKEVATLAVSCVKLKEEERPTMRQVEMALEALQRPTEIVRGDLIQETDGKNYASTKHASTSQLANQSEASRCHSQEEEFLLSAKYPR